MISSSSRITSLWSRFLATEQSTKLAILGYFASSNEHCLGILKSRISPGRQTPLLMQHLAIHHRVSMQSSHVSPYAPEWILRRAQSWERIAMEISSDSGMCLLLVTIEKGFPDTRRETTDTVAAFWMYRDSLCVSDGAILYQDRVVSPTCRRNEVLRTLHSAHQGVSSMESRARSIVFWPGIFSAIQDTRDRCRSYKKQHHHMLRLLQRRLTRRRIRLSQLLLTSVITADAITSSLVTVFRVGWTSTKHPRVHHTGLIACLRQMFATFGVPEILSSDGDPESTASETSKFLQRWVVRRLGSVAEAKPEA